MICKNCIYPYIEETKEGKDMAKMGYRLCKAARTSEEKAVYITSMNECKWKDRSKTK